MSDKGMKLGRVKISFQALEDFFFPPGTRIVRIFPENPELYSSRIAEFVVENDELLVVREGEVIPIVTVEIQEKPISTPTFREYEKKFSK